MSEQDVAWSAGILEGEGSFFLKSDKTPVVQCEMTDLDVLEKLQSLYGGSIQTIKKRKEHWKQSWRWVTMGTNAVSVMEAIKPYLMSRRTEKVNSILTAWSGRVDNRSIVNHNVLTAAQEYIANEGKVSYRALASKYGVSYESIRRKVFEID